MIISTFSYSEIKKECELIDKEIVKLFPKASKVFKNWVKNNRRYGLICLGHDITKIKDNTVHIFWFGDRVKNKNDLGYYSLVEYKTYDGKTRYIYILPKQTVEGYGKNQDFQIVIFTNHFAKRIKERMNETFVDWFYNFIIKYEGYTIIDDKEADKITASLGDTYCFGYNKGNNVIVLTTCINDDLKFENQEQEHIILKNEILDFSFLSRKLLEQVY